MCSLYLMVIAFDINFLHLIGTQKLLEIEIGELLCNKVSQLRFCTEAFWDLLFWFHLKQFGQFWILKYILYFWYWTELLGYVVQKVSETRSATDTSTFSRCELRVKDWSP